jgi:hypothetical protein
MIIPHGSFESCGILLSTLVAFPRTTVRGIKTTGYAGALERL